jgi:hypothetical protein
MFTGRKLALAIALAAGSASVASAQGFDPNPDRRFSLFANPGGQYMPYIAIIPDVSPIAEMLQSAPVGMYSDRIAPAVIRQYAGTGYLRAASGETGYGSPN